MTTLIFMAAVHHSRFCGSLNIFVIWNEMGKHRFLSFIVRDFECTLTIKIGF